MTSIVVTGGSGKAGRAVIRDLLAHGYAVLNVDIVPPSEPLRLMAVHAHPDDESSKGVATMARYVREGAEVMVKVSDANLRKFLCSEAHLKSYQCQWSVARQRSSN